MAGKIDQEKLDYIHANSPKEDINGAYELMRHKRKSKIEGGELSISAKLIKAGMEQNIAWRFQPNDRSRNSAYIKPKKIGGKFTPEEMQVLKDFAKSLGLEVSSESSSTSIRVIDPDYKNASNLQRLSASEPVVVTDRQKKLQEKERLAEERKQQESEEYEQSSSKNWIESVFGNMNAYNKKAMANFLDEKTKNFEGMVSSSSIEALENLGALSQEDENGRRNIDWNKIKEAYLSSKNISAKQVKAFQNDIIQQMKNEGLSEEEIDGVYLSTDSLAYNLESLAEKKDLYHDRPLTQKETDFRTGQVINASENLKIYGEPFVEIYEMFSDNKTPEASEMYKYISKLESIAEKIHKFQEEDKMKSKSIFAEARKAIKAIEENENTDIDMSNDMQEETFEEVEDKKEEESETEGKGELTPEHEDAILEFVVTTENLDDSDFHMFCEELGVDKHEAEEVVYRAFRELVLTVEEDAEEAGETEEAENEMENETEEYFEDEDEKVNAKKVNASEGKGVLDAIYILHNIKKELDRKIPIIEDKYEKFVSPDPEEISDEHRAIGDKLEKMMDASKILRQAISSLEDIEYVDKMSTEAKKVNSLDMASTRSTEDILRAIEILKNAGISEDIVFILEEELPEESQGQIATAAKKTDAALTKTDRGYIAVLQQLKDDVEQLKSPENKPALAKVQKKIDSIIDNVVSNAKRDEELKNKYSTRKAEAKKVEADEEKESKDIDETPIEESKDKTEELEQGKEVEKEHSETYKKMKKYFEENGKWPSFELFTEWIAEDHTGEFSDYYDALAKMEAELKKDKVEASSEDYGTRNPMEGDYVIRINPNGTQYEVIKVGKGVIGTALNYVGAEEVVRKNGAKEEEKGYVWSQANLGMLERVADFNWLKRNLAQKASNYKHF